jgi:uncharacterized protein with HEPN domain
VSAENGAVAEIAGIQGLRKDADLGAFSASWGMKRAVEHALLIIAEAAKHLPQPMKDARPEVPWSKIHGLGNLLRHEYRHVDPWRRSLPRRVSMAQKML